MKQQRNYARRFEQVNLLSDVLQETLDENGIMEIRKDDYMKQREVDSYWFWDTTEQLSFIKIYCSEYNKCSKVYKTLINKDNLESRLGFEILIRHTNPEVIFVYIDPPKIKMSIKR